MGGDMFRDMGKVLLTAAFGVAVIGGGVGYGIHHFVDKAEAPTVGVRLTKEQEILRKNGALCDAYMKAAFDQSLAQGKVVDLKLPPNPAQNCPDSPKLAPKN